MAMRGTTYTSKEEAREYAKMVMVARKKGNDYKGFLFRKYKLESVELDKQGISATQQLVIFREKEYLEKNGVPMPKREETVYIPDDEPPTFFDKFQAYFWRFTFWAIKWIATLFVVVLIIGLARKF